MHLLLPVLFVVGFLVFFLFLRRLPDRRRELADWARRRGLDFRPAPDYALPHRLADLRYLQQGRDTYAYNVSSGTCDDLPVVAFDYHYKVLSDRGETDYLFAAVAVESPTPLRPMHVRPRGFSVQFRDPDGWEAVEAGTPEFRREYHVAAADPAWARRVLTPELAAFLLAAPDFSVEFGRSHLLAWNGRCFGPGEFDSAVRVLRGILDRLPAEDDG
jgi:hypothetical protein